MPAKKQPKTEVLTDNQSTITQENETIMPETILLTGNNGEVTPMLPEALPVDTGESVVLEPSEYYVFWDGKLAFIAYADKFGWIDDNDHVVVSDDLPAGLSGDSYPEMSQDMQKHITPQIKRVLEAMGYVAPEQPVEVSQDTANDTPETTDDTPKEEAKEQDETTESEKPEKVVKTVVPKKIPASGLDDYDTAILNLFLASPLLSKVIEAMRNAPKLKEDMVKAELNRQEVLTQEYQAMMSKGIIMPFTPEFEALQNIMVNLHAAKLEQARIEALPVESLAHDSLKELRESVARDVEAVRLSVFGTQTENSGRPEGSNTPSTNGRGRAFSFESRDTTVSYYRYNSDLGTDMLIAPISWLSVEYREKHEINVSDSCYVAVNRKDGSLFAKLSPGSLTSVFEAIDELQGKTHNSKGDSGKNYSSEGSAETEKNKKAFPVLTKTEFLALVGDVGLEAEKPEALEVSEEVTA